MYKKILCLTSAAVLVAGLTACGSKSAATEPVSAATSATTEVTVETTEETSPLVIFQETVLVDDENCTFTITAIEESNAWGYTLKAYLENKTDLDLTFSLSNVSVNGFMCDPFWAASVSAGMKASKDISFTQDSFDRNGITNVTDIAFTLDVYDSNDWTADHLVSQVFSIYPMGEEAVEMYEREAQDSDIVLFDDENCTMIVTGFDPENMWGYAVNVYLVNKTDKILMFSVSDAAVNGFMCDPYWAETVAPGKCSNTSLTWSASALENAGITDVESLHIPVRVYDSGDWMAEDLINEAFTLNP